MLQRERNSAAGTSPDLSLLDQMVGMKKGLALMAEQGILPSREVILALLETEKEVYASHGGFANKDRALGEIIAGFRQGTIGVEDLFRAAGIDPEMIQPPKGGFSLKRLWDSIRSK
jgi:hypothetical protein